MKLNDLIDQAPGPVHLWEDGESVVMKFVEGYGRWWPLEFPGWVIEVWKTASAAEINIQPHNRKLLQAMIPDHDWEQTEYIPVIVWDARYVGVVPTSIWAMSAEGLECGSFPVWMQKWANGKPEVVLA